MESPLVSIIIVNWNGKHFLENCLKSLFPQSYPNYEVILVDNASTDDSVEFVKMNFPLVRIYAQKENLEFARGNNFGFKVSKGEFVIALNSDTTVPFNFIEEMVRPALLDDRIGSVGCNIDTQGSLTRYASVIMKNGLLSGLSIDMSSQPIFIMAACGAAALYRKDFIEKFWGYDEEFITNWEDHSMGYRMWVLGYYCVHNPNIIIQHIGGGSYGKFNSKREKLVIRNKLATYFLNKEKDLFRTLISSLTLDTKRFLPNSPLFLLSVIIGSFTFILRLRDKRKIIQKNRKFNDEFIMKYADGHTLWILNEKIIF